MSYLRYVLLLEKELHRADVSQRVSRGRGSLVRPRLMELGLV